MAASDTELLRSTRTGRRRGEASLRDAIGVGIATGAYGLSFGGISSTSGLSVLQTCVLSLALFSGASQFALVGVIGAGGNPMTGAATAAMLGVRNGFYGMRLAGLLRLPRALAAGRGAAGHRREHGDGDRARIATGGPAGFLGHRALGFCVLERGHADRRPGRARAERPAHVWASMLPRRPRFSRCCRRDCVAASPAWSPCVAAVVALASVPFVPTGVPVLLAAAVAIVAGIRPPTRAASWPSRRARAGARLMWPAVIVAS